MSNLYRGPSIDASYQFRFICPRSFRGEDFLEIDQPETRIANDNRLLMDQDEISNLYKGPSIYASYQVSVHLVKRFQRRSFLEIDQPETRIAYGGHVC